jgi:hypothetical protein
MKFGSIALVCTACLLGLAIEGFAATYGRGFGGYGGYGYRGGVQFLPVPVGGFGVGARTGFGSGAFLALIGLLFILLLLFTNFTATSQPAVTIVG